MRLAGRLPTALLAAACLVGGLAVAAGPHGRGRGPAPATALHASLSRYADNGVLPYGSAGWEGSPASSVVTSPVVAMAATSGDHGYWLAGANGAVYAYGGARNYGSAVNRHLRAPITSIAATPDGRGYWLMTAEGAVYEFGDARRMFPARPAALRDIVQLVPTHDGGGYWQVAANGQVRVWGDAGFYGGLAGVVLASPVVGMAVTADGRGYWLATAGGTVYPFGDARSYTQTGGGALTATVAGIAATRDGKGYWLVANNGVVQAWGDARWLGDNGLAFPVQPDAGIVAAPVGTGYWLLEPDAFPTSFTNPGSTSPLGRHIVAAAASQVAGDPDAGEFCNAYGPCEAWCALFASWAWEAAGVDMARYAFTGYVYDWAASRTGVLAPSARPAPGDAVLYGTGPWSTATSVHMGIVAQVWPDGYIDTVEGDAGPATYGHYGVVINGPYLPVWSDAYNGVGVYGFAIP